MDKRKKNQSLLREKKNPATYRENRMRAINAFLLINEELIYQTGNATGELSEYEIRRIMRDGRLFATVVM